MDAFSGNAFNKNLKEISSERQRFELTLEYLEHNYYSHWTSEHQVRLNSTADEAYKWGRKHVEEARKSKIGLIMMAQAMKKDLERLQKEAS